ncbi:Lanthionine biosynthesis protein LanM [uncultured Candidatus Thioglobus sp.]|nr:Lanthionine biosynthesis protein LanM [uncultured Candidatus Thioglobus sp.]
MITQNDTSIYEWIAQASNPSERINCPAFAVADEQDDTINKDRLKQFQAMLDANPQNKDKILDSLKLKPEQLKQAVLNVKVVDKTALPDWAKNFYQLMNSWQNAVDNKQDLATLVDYQGGMDEKKFAFNFTLLAKMQLRPMIDTLLSHHIEIKPQAINALLEYFTYRLYTPVLNTAFSCYFKQLDPKNNQKIDYNTLSTWQFYLTDQPVIARIIGTINTDWLETTLEMLSRFHTDIAIINKHFFDNKHNNNQNIQILDIKPGLGDPHRGGRSVAIITTNLGEVVYKPKSLFGTYAIGKFLQTLHPLQPDCVPLTPKFVNQGDYGWEQKVNASSASTKEEVNIYYQRLGAWLRILQVLNANDFWYDNLIAAGDMPYFIDYETIIGLPMFEKNSAANSLANVGMLPRITPSDNDLIDISCFVSPGEQKTPIKNHSKFSEEDRLVLTAEDFAAYLNGEFQDINHYFGAFEHGFKAINKLLLSPTGVTALDDFLTAIAPAKFRHIYIDTWTAYDLISTAFSQCCRDGVRQEIAHHRYLFAKLNYYDFKVIDSAIKSIQRNDIPIYEIDALTNNAYTHENHLIENASKKSPIYYIKENIARLENVDEDFDIVKTLYSMRLDEFKPPYEHQPNQPIPTYDALDIAKNIGQYLLSLLNQGTESINQITHSEFLKYQALMPLSHGFDGSMGLLLLFQRLYEITNETVYYQALEQLYELSKKSDINDYKSNGMLGDNVAKIMLYNQLTPYFDSSSAIHSNYQHLMSTLDKSNDLIGGYGIGVSGLLVVLANTKAIDVSAYQAQVKQYLADKTLVKYDQSLWIENYIATFYPDDTLADKLAQSYYTDTLGLAGADAPIVLETKANINTDIYLQHSDKADIIDKIVTLTPKNLATAKTQDIINSLYNYLYFEKYHQQTHNSIKTLSLALINRFSANNQWFCDSWAQDKHQLSARGGLVDIGLAFLAQVDNSKPLNIARLAE